MTQIRKNPTSGELDGFSNGNEHDQILNDEYTNVPLAILRLRAAHEQDAGTFTSALSRTIDQLDLEAGR